LLYCVSNSNLSFFSGQNALVPKQHRSASLIMVKPQALPLFWKNRIAGKVLRRM